MIPKPNWGNLDNNPGADSGYVKSVGLTNLFFAENM